MTSCGDCGPGYKSPSAACLAEKEKLVYTVAIYCGEDKAKPDRLVTIDVDVNSPTYSKIIHKLDMKYVGDELHHFGWNTCSSCCGDPTKVRRFLIVPGFKSTRIYIIDTIEPTKPSIHKIIEPKEILEGQNLSSPHTVHCLANGNIMILCLGDRDGNAPGGFLLISENFEIIGKWAEEEFKNKVNYSYDFWYQPYHNVMVSSEWSSPAVYGKGFNTDEWKASKFGRKIYFWNWTEGTVMKSVDLGEDGHIPLEVRFHHNPTSTHGFVGVALSSSIFHWWKEQDEWKVEKIIQVEPVSVDSSPTPVPALITDILISMDDRFLYFCNWLHGDIRQYDIRDPSKPTLVGQVWCGGLIGKEVKHHGKKLTGGPQMIQLSLDGKRLYVTNSLFSSWDDQFYPDMAKQGSHMLKVNCDTEKGGLSIDEKYFIDFGMEDGLFRAHETRYPGGDCSSDIFLN